MMKNGKSGSYGRYDSRDDIPHGISSFQISKAGVMLVLSFNQEISSFIQPS
jgi:hypothetical protein